MLSVKLDGGYLEASQVDSAFASWLPAPGNPVTVAQRVKMQVRYDSLVVRLDEFTEGKGTLTIQVYTHKKYYNQYRSQFISTRHFLLQHQQPRSYQGPQSFFDADWLPRVELKDGIGHEAVVALRPGDPYFLVKQPPHALYQLVVDRGYWKTKQGISFSGGAIWECKINCTDIENTDFFTVLPGRIANKPWDHISITILFEIKADGEAWLLTLEEDV